ncbi:cyclophilin-like fold protein [Adlercreutzia sp. ZJ141]|uniref:cyclophilin-like fold protein n=1 Tax=Adlercreutzia sp. ZJ141 TaxID=2709406 RepID=UPI0013EC2C42|nr:cyclophilin-like fold protein [Adlercreutzia sp. ZJ141]
MHIEIDFDTTTVSGTLNDTETAKAFFDALPLSIHVGTSGMDFCGQMGQSFPYEPSHVGFGWKNGDINYNPSGGWFAVFFDGENISGSYGDQVNMGHLDDDAIEALSKLKGSYEITIRKA